MFTLSLNLHGGWCELMNKSAMRVDITIGKSISLKQSLIRYLCPTLADEYLCIELHRSNYLEYNTMKSETLPFKIMEKNVIRDLKASLLCYHFISWNMIYIDWS